MKNSIITPLLIVGLFSCQSSGNGHNEPEAVSLTFISLLTEGSFEEAAQLATPNSAQSIKLFSKKLAGMDEDSKKHILTGFENDRSSIQCQFLSENEVQCHVCCSVNEEEAILDVVKMDGEWRIASLFDL